MPFYTPLDKDKAEIRLVRFIQRSKSRHARIRLELCHASLDDQNTQYAALSYVWGDQSNPREIIISGHVTPIGRSLHAVLSHLYQTGVSSWLWIDAICIQQSNIEEKNWQVAQMCSVYSQAETVYSWLGQGTWRTDAAMDLLCNIGPRASSLGVVGFHEKPPKRSEVDYALKFQSRFVETLPKGVTFLGLKARLSRKMKRNPLGARKNETELERLMIDIYREEGLWNSWNTLDPKPGEMHIQLGISEIMARDYWSRIWIIQEVALGKSATLICGQKSISVDHLDAALWMLNFCREPKSDDGFIHLAHHWFLGRLTISNFLLINALSARHHLQKKQGKIALWKLLVARGTVDSRTHYSASDSRDLLFGVLGVISEQSDLRFVVDYTLSMVDVFCQLTKALYFLSEGNASYFSLDACPPRPCPQAGETMSLPSWVPDWVSVGRHGITMIPINYSGTYHAAPTELPKEKEAEAIHRGPEDLKILRRRGLVVDTITAVLNFPQWNNVPEGWLPTEEDVRLWLNSITTFMELEGESGPGEDYIWRTIVSEKGRILSNNEAQTEPSSAMRAATAWYLRKIMREEPIDMASLTAEEEEVLRTGSCGRHLLGPYSKDLQEEIAETRRRLLFTACQDVQQRMTFKTQKSMLGSGHLVVREGDIVTLIQGLGSPIVLRPREEGGFVFMGDAYVDGIMQGEFLKTKPVFRDFDIY